MLVAPRPRSYVRVSGPGAEDYLNRMLSNDVAALAPGEACEALLLTPKGRVLAPLVALRRADDDYLLLTEPELGGRLRDELLRSRFAARVDVETEEHTSHVVLGGTGIPTEAYGEPAAEVLDAELAPTLSAEELELRRIRAGTPAWGREIDERVLPAEAGLDRSAISFTKGCYPGQEPVARLHYRGRANRSLRVLALEGDELPQDDAELELDGHVLGRVTSAARNGAGIVALGYLRRAVPPDAVLRVGRRAATQLH